MNSTAAVTFMCLLAITTALLPACGQAGEGAVADDAQADAALQDTAADATGDVTPHGCATAAALSTCASPTQSGAFYVDQAQRYFDALDRSQPNDRVPTYAENVMRWEWPPWLKLTGYTREQMEGTDKLVKTGAPAVVSHRDCRAFAVQPFARCRVSFDYDNQGGGKPCWIYEEFTFNDQGEMTFVEAWSDLPGLRATEDAGDPWAEGKGVHRLSTRVPGLGTPTGHVTPTDAALVAAAALDPELADMVARMLDFWPKWIEENNKDPDYFAVGCGW